MRVTGGVTVEVLRSGGADRFGDKTFVSIGTIDHVVVQGANATSSALRFHSSRSFQETSDTSEMIFCPREADIVLRARDRIKIGETVYQVVGDPLWADDNPVTGSRYSHYMMQVEMVV